MLLISTIKTLIYVAKLLEIVLESIYLQCPLTIIRDEASLEQLENLLHTLIMLLFVI